MMVGFTGILFGMFAIGVMQLILAASLPFIVSEIGGGSMYSWVFSSYMLASLATIPLFSKLADIYGRRRFYILGMSIFAVGTLYGGFADGMTHLIAARIIQGLSAGILIPVSIAMVTDMFPPEKRGSMIGLLGFVQLLSNLLSPPLGGLLTTHLSWRWIFYFTFILIFISITFFIFSGNRNEIKSYAKPLKIDISGAMVFGILCMLVVSFSNIVSEKGRLDNISLMIILAAGALTVLLIYIEKGHENPIIKIEFIKTNVIRSSIISALLTGAIMFGLVSTLPLCGLLLSEKGYRINESTLLLIFMIGSTTGLFVSSRLKNKLKSGVFTIVLWMAMTICSVLIIFAIRNEAMIAFYTLVICIGLSNGGIMATFLIDSQNAVSSEDRAVLSGLVQLGRYLGASIGVTILIGLLPESSDIKSVEQFTGIFIILVVLSLIGLINSSFGKNLNLKASS